LTKGRAVFSADVFRSEESAVVLVRLAYPDAGTACGLMFVLDLGIVFKAGLVVIAALIWYEHTLVKADNFTSIPVAFFNVNAAVSLSMLVFTVADVMVPIF